MKVLVTGGAGFVGTNLIKRLLKDDYEVVSVDIYSTGKKENINKEVVWSDMDISNEHSVPYIEQMMKDVDVVFHTAAKARVQPSIEDPISFNKTNVDGTLHLL